MPSSQLSKISKRTLLILLILLIGFISLGIYGWSRTFKDAGSDPTYLESAMQSVEMITSDRTLIFNATYSKHWTVLVSFFGIKAVLIYTFFYSALFFLRRKMAVWNFRKKKGHTVIFGFNEETKKLVGHYLKKGNALALIGEDNNDSDYQSLEDQGVLVILGNPEDEKLLKKVQLARAAKVIVATNNESKNVNVAEKVSSCVKNNTEISGKIEVLVRVESDKLRNVLEKRWKVFESTECVFRIINFQSTAIREVISEIAIDLCGEAKIRKQGPRFLIVADSSLSDHLLRQAIIFVQVSGESVPLFTIPNEDAGIESYFRSTYPDIDLVADVNYVECSKNRIANSEKFAGQSFDAVIVCMDNELETMGLTYELLDSNSINIDKGYAILRESQKMEMTHDERLKIMLLTDYGLKSPEFGDSDMEKEAEDNHNAYLSGLSEEKRSVAKEWRQLDYATKEANRLAVLHRKVKLKIQEITGDENEEEMISLLACSEHQRWKAEKIFSGWIGGPVRDNKRKIHDNICPYSELSDEIKGYDVTQVRKALGL